LVDENQLLQFDQFKYFYAEILYRWQLLNKRMEVLKFLQHPVPQKSEIGKKKKKKKIRKNFKSILFQKTKI